MCYLPAREGSLTFFFWFALQVPKSQHKEMTAERVNMTLCRELLASANGTGRLSYQAEYEVDPDSLVLLGMYQPPKCDLSFQDQGLRPISCCQQAERLG